MVDWPWRPWQDVRALELFVALLWHYGARDIAAATAAAGWGLLYVAAFRFVTIATDSLGWRALLSLPDRPLVDARQIFVHSAALHVLDH